MDRKKGILNISSSIISRIVLLFAALYVRRLLIQYIGNDANGLNSLYGSILGLLSVAELGVGSAIVFSMYRPIVDKNDTVVAALYSLYKKLYRIIGAVIFFAGMAVMPFLPKLISDYDSISVNVYTTFILTLISVTVSYLYSAKTSLIEAHKNNYITTGIITISKLLRYCLQAAAILIWRSYIIYLTCQIIESIAIWIMTEVMVRRLHPDIISMRERLDDETGKEVSRNVRAMFLHKIGSIMVGAIDSLIISSFIGVVILGKYSNYIVIVGVVTSIIALFFTPLTSVIGHMCASSTPSDIQRYFEYFYTLNYILGVVFLLGYYTVADNLIVLIFGPGLEMSDVVVFVITLNQFIGYMRSAQLTFRDASGTFYYDRWKPVVEGVVNLVLSIALVKLLPSEYAVAGVIAATIVTCLLICDTVEPYILYRYVFRQNVGSFYMKNYSYIALFTISLLIVEKLKISADSELVELFANGAISVAVSVTLLFLISLIDRQFKEDCRTIIKQFGNLIGCIRE